MKPVHTALAAFVSAVLTASLLATNVAPAQAATTTFVWGTTRCDGTWVNYTTERAMSSARYVKLNALDFSGSLNGGLGMYVGATVGGTHHDKWFAPSSPTHQLVPTNKYAKGKKFTLRARQVASSGTCDYEWDGNLTY
nr:hypothetical protein [Propionicimonas sp.]